MKRDLAIVAGLVISTLAVYAQTLGFEFLSYDDQSFVTDHAWVHEGLSFDGVRIAFVKQSAPLNWLPLTVLSYMLDASLFGVDAAGFHATNVALHALDVVLVYLLLRTLTAAVWPSAIVAALFALHPMRVESVAWVSGRKDVLSAAFGLLALIAYTRYAKRGSWRAYAVAFTCTVGALLSKATWVSLPALFVLLDFWPLRRFGPNAPEADAFRVPAARRARVSHLLAEKLPFFAAAAAMMFVTSEFQAGIRVPLERLSIAERFTHALVGYAWYVAKTVWPARLSPHYPHPYLVGGGVPWTGAEIALAALLLVTLTALAARWVRRGYPVVGWLWFLGTLVPVLGFVQHGTQGMADRYTHIPHIGLFLAAVFGGWELLVPRLRSTTLRRIAAAAVVAILFALGSAAFLQTRVWRNTDSLFTYALRVMPQDAMIQQGIAHCDLEAGRLDDALHHAKTALDLRPGFRRARGVLAQALARRAAATPSAPAPDFLFDGGTNDAFIHEEMAEIASARGDREAALAHVRSALALTPDSIRALWQLGELLRERGDHVGANEAFQRAVALADSIQAQPGEDEPAQAPLR
jgi:tetratricopeptide (TPR) repeat protein